MKKFFYFIIPLSLLILGVYSCSFNEDDLCETSGRFADVDYSDISVSTDRLPLYANIGNADTKSVNPDEESQMVSLESLLDRENTISKTFEQYELTEIPFKSNKSPNYAVLSDCMPESITNEFQSKISLFLVETINTEENTIDRKVVTVIPDKDYVCRYSDENTSFINKGIFSGTILYSNLDGTFRDVYVYGGDFCPIINADIIDSSQIAQYSDYCFLSLVKAVETKSDTNPELNASYCIAYKTGEQPEDDTVVNYVEGPGDEELGDYPSITDPVSGAGGSSDVGVIGSGGDVNEDTGLGGSGNEDPDNVGVDKDDEYGENIITVGDQNGNQLPQSPSVGEDVQKYMVSLYAADGGNTRGSGEYQVGAMVTCSALPNISYVFDRWVGDLHGEDYQTYITVTKNIEATAYFHPLLNINQRRPCYDAFRRLYNPLMEMSVAPSSSWNPEGGTFGMTRFEPLEKRKFHSGLDLSAEPGTPIFAMYDGVVSDYSYCVEQVDRISENDYPKWYKGDINGAGNRVHVKSNVSGMDVLIGYWHLLDGNPIAVNPRTGAPFAPGDKVYQGEIIGYTGKTGNCYNIPNYHLHLVIIDYAKRNAGNDKYLNPECYINGNIDWSDSNKKKLESLNIINIKCNDEYENTKEL